MTVLLFAAAREAAGSARLQLELAPGTTLAEVADQLVAELGEHMRPLLATCAMWLNGEPVSPSTALSPGDELAVLPPVSGG